MSIPLRSRVHTRILLNFRVDPKLLRPFIPAGLEPVLVNGAAVAGVCFIRQERIRPAGMPGFTGVALEAAAHRVAVMRDGERAVLVLRRDAPGLLPRIASRITAATFGAGEITWEGLTARLTASDGATASIDAASGDRPERWTVAPIEHATLASSFLATLGAEPDSAFVARDLDAVWS